MTMTAKELYRIVEDVPEEIWPSGFYFNGSKSWVESGSCDAVSDELAELAFVGAMVAYQIDLGNIVWQRESDGVFCVGPWNSGEQVEAPTLIEALAAACKEAK